MTTLCPEISETRRFDIKHSMVFFTFGGKSRWCDSPNLELLKNHIAENEGASLIILQIVLLFSLFSRCTL